MDSKTYYLIIYYRGQDGATLARLVSVDVNNDSCTKLPIGANEHLEELGFNPSQDDITAIIDVMTGSEGQLLIPRIIADDQDITPDFEDCLHLDGQPISTGEPVEQIHDPNT